MNCRARLTSYVYLLIPVLLRGWNLHAPQPPERFPGRRVWDFWEILLDQVQPPDLQPDPAITGRGPHIWPSESPDPETCQQVNLAFSFVDFFSFIKLLVVVVVVWFYSYFLFLLFFFSLLGLWVFGNSDLLYLVDFFITFSAIRSIEKVLHLPKKSTSRFWWMFTFWGPLNPKKLFLACRLSVCLSVCGHHNSKNNWASSTKFGMWSYMIKISVGIAYEQNRPKGVTSALRGQFGFWAKSALKRHCTNIF